MNLHDLFAIPRHRAPEKLALLFQDDALTYGDLFARADALAAGLAARGVRKGDR
ncbi:MAG TPA: AMP-binding protein, partial [Thermoanaerobaculia bacterium]|nr:AMP-binding protein [Thermoanaerobaculia bacterium]